MNRLAIPSLDNEHGAAGRLDEAYGNEDPARRVAPWKTSHQTFGQRLRAQRERRGIALEDIAESSKIKVSLLVDLERDDLSRWPQGVFGRGFVRAYAVAIGLAPGPVVAEFAALCPDERDGAEGSAVGGGSENDLRLTLAGDGRAALSQMALRAYAATIEAGLVVAAGFALASLRPDIGWHLEWALAVGYYAVSAAVLGRSPSQWWLQYRRLRALRHADQGCQGASRRQLQLVVSRPPGETSTPPGADHDHPPISARG